MGVNDLIDNAERLKLMFIARATGGAVDERDYRTLRSKVLEGAPGKLAPAFVRACRTTDEFWAHIKEKFTTYKERREYLRSEFEPLLHALEQGGSPVDRRTAEVITAYDSEHVRAVWTKALERRTADPEGAITAARTLLESVCKHLLDDLGKTYSADADLPGLYSIVSKGLGIAPSQHTEKIFKQILGGCQAVVEGLGALRNKVGDAHGQGQRAVRPGARHAELAVNLAASMATFLLSTHQERQALAVKP